MENNSANNDYIILGCGGHARSVADILLYNKNQVNITFIDNNARENETIYNFPVLKNLDNTIYNKNIILGIGDNKIREKLYKEYKNNVISLISKNTYFGYNVNIGNGTFIAEGVHLGPSVNIGIGCIINTKAVLDHEVTIGDFTHVSVNATLCGKVKIGNNVFVGAGTVIKDGISICDDVIIGAGAVVVKNVMEKGTYVGCPVKKIKEI